MPLVDDPAYHQGQTDARLDAHDRQLAAINGSVARTAVAVADLAKAVTNQTLEIQALRLEAVAREATVVTTAQALKDAEEARRDKSEQTWSTPLKVTAILASTATVVGTILGFAVIIN